jgi:phosphatidylinositol 4-kinase B
MQAALKDLSDHSHNAPQFMICQRVLHRCHEIIFGDLPQAVAPYSTLSLPFQSRFMRKKIKHHRDPVVVGIGMVLAGVPALPQLTQIMGQVAIEQGRAEETGFEERSIESLEDMTSSGAAVVDEPDELPTDDGDGDDGSVEDNPTINNASSTGDLLKFNPGTLGRRKVVGAAQTTPALPLHLHGIRRSRNSEDPLGQLDAEQVSTPFQSSPSISASRPNPRTASLNHADTILQTYDVPSQIHLLKSNYCRSEVGRQLHSQILLDLSLCTGFIHSYTGEHMRSTASRAQACSC